MWDWERLGVDGRPRAINIEHAKNVIHWDRTTEWTRKNLINVIEKVAEGDEILIERPANAFEPFEVHYAETFIVPAAVSAYTMKPTGKSIGQKCGTMLAFVRKNA